MFYDAHRGSNHPLSKVQVEQISAVLHVASLQIVVI